MERTPPTPLDSSRDDHGSDGRAGQLVCGRYRIRRRIAVGGMGEVFEAEQIALGRAVALKFIRRARRSEAIAVERFMREARTLASFGGDHVVGVLDVERDDEGVPFMAMELLEGEDLATLLARGPLPAAVAAELVRQACEGLRRAHEAGVVHRDLKPANLFVCRRDHGPRVKLLDFGIAKVPPQPSAASLTGTGEALGTPHYMAPEQARGADCDARTDVHALGAILYEAISGRKAHPGTTYNEVLYHVLTCAPEPLGDVASGLPIGLDALVARAMAALPDDRQENACALAAALEPYVATSSPTVTGMPLPPATRDSRSPFDGTRTRYMRWLVAAVAVATTAAVSATLLRQQRAPSHALTSLEPAAAPARSAAPRPQTSPTAVTPTPSPSAPSVSTNDQLQKARPSARVRVERRAPVAAPPPAAAAAPTAASGAVTTPPRDRRAPLVFERENPYE